LVSSGQAFASRFRPYPVGAGRTLTFGSFESLSRPLFLCAPESRFVIGAGQGDALPLHFFALSSLLVDERFHSGFSHRETHFSLFDFALARLFLEPDLSRTLMTQ